MAQKPGVYTEKVIVEVAGDSVIVIISRLHTGPLYGQEQANLQQLARAYAHKYVGEVRLSQDTCLMTNSKVIIKFLF